MQHNNIALSKIILPDHLRRSEHANNMRQVGVRDAYQRGAGLVERRRHVSMSSIVKQTDYI